MYSIHGLVRVCVELNKAFVHEQREGFHNPTVPRFHTGL